MLWIKHNQPELLERAGAALLCKDLLTLLLTGNRVSDYSDMSGAGLLRLPERTYDTELLDAYGLKEVAPLLPEMVESEAAAGCVSATAARATGLLEGTPVSGGFFDVVASMIGSGAGKPGDAAIIAGTWGINQVVRDRPLVDDRVFHNSTWRPDRYIAIESSATSAVNLEWYVREFGGGHDETAFETCNQLVASVDPAVEAPLYLPFLYGSATHPYARGAFIGLSGWHTKAHLLYALYEGVAFEHRRHIEKLKSAGATFARAVLSGGGSRSIVWRQMFADIIGVPVMVAECQETGALGAAISGGVAGGIFNALEEGMSAMVRQSGTYVPDAQKRCLFNARYDFFQSLAEEMPERWKHYLGQAMP